MAPSGFREAEDVADDAVIVLEAEGGKEEIPSIWSRSGLGEGAVVVVGGVGMTVVVSPPPLPPHSPYNICINA